MTALMVFGREKAMADTAKRARMKWVHCIVAIGFDREILIRYDVRDVSIFDRR